MKRIAFFTCLILLSTEAHAGCDSCFLPRLGRDSDYSLGADRSGVFFDFRFEQQNWDSAELEEHQEENEEMHHDSHESDQEHEEHLSIFRHAGHDHEEAEEHGHTHNRTQDRIYHFNLGANVTETVSVLAHLPYVERFDSQTTGVEESNGLGDLNIIGTWRFMPYSKGYLGAVGGVKFSTGETREKNSVGERFEPELQPGTGSTDVTLGFVFEHQLESLILRGNALYSLKTEGDQEYEFGDLTSLSFFVDVPVIETNGFNSFIGIDTNFQYADKDEQKGETIIDSGGALLFMGPTITLRYMKRALFSAAVLFPVAQERGGDHQDLDTIWTAGLRVFF